MATKVKIDVSELLAARKRVKATEAAAAKAREEAKDAKRQRQRVKSETEAAIITAALKAGNFTLVNFSQSATCYTHQRNMPVPALFALFDKITEHQRKAEQLARLIDVLTDSKRSIIDSFKTAGYTDSEIAQLLTLAPNALQKVAS